MINGMDVEFLDVLKIIILVIINVDSKQYIIHIVLKTLHVLIKLCSFKA